MRTSSPFFVWGACALALALWIGVIFFALSIDARQASVVASIKAGTQDAALRASTRSAFALAAATAGERTKLEEVVNRDILTLSDMIGQAGQDAGISLSVVSVVPGPGPSLPQGSVLHPSSVIFSVKASGSFAQLMTAAALLQSLPLASTIESVQFSRSDTVGLWNMILTVGVSTGSSINS